MEIPGWAIGRGVQRPPLRSRRRVPFFVPRRIVSDMWCSCQRKRELTPVVARGHPQPGPPSIKKFGGPCRSRDAPFVVQSEGGGPVMEAGTLSRNTGDDMRVMVMVKATKNSEAGMLPSEKLLTDMGKFNEELVKAGVMLAGDG